MPSPIRRQRLLTFCAIVIVFMLYRAFQNSYDSSPVYDSLHTHEYEKPPTAGQSPPPPDYEPAVENVHAPAATAPAAAVDVDRQSTEYKDDKYDLSSPTESLEKGKKPGSTTHSSDEDSSEVKIPELNASPEVDKSPSSKDKTQGSTSGKDSSYNDLDDEAKSDKSGSNLVSGSGSSHDSGSGSGFGSSSFSNEPSSKESSFEEPSSEESTPKGSLDVQWKNPPHDSTNKALLGSERIHWEKMPENFPLPEESIIPLPTGKPAKIPKIQHNFGAESEKAKKTRQDRLKRVQKEIERSWKGYRKNAWMHDELSPLSGKFRDPFGGWGATLVDSLDTLWIAGLKAEFEEAVEAVAEIDFTWTPRNDIPVFETTIRYLGGLLGAYDVSGGAAGGHGVLLDKAVELGEILMGIFDTPNRMPILYYQWQPQFASQPHRAGRVGIAELATLSMEFTRLSQVTGEDKYYDAIDRITNGLVDMQAEGTRIPGLFPEAIDASGCNKTATTVEENVSKEAQQQLDDSLRSTEPVGYVSGTGKDKIPDEDDRLSRRAVVAEEKTAPEKSDPPPSSFSSQNQQGPVAANGQKSKWDCVPQGLVPAGMGYQSFSMGGGQDSAYEYFPKEYLLLGGLEAKYQKLYEDSVDAVNEWLLYRPMADDDWDVVFPASVSFNNHEKDKPSPQFEISHLTCFIGAMYGLGGRIFEREADVEMAKKLTDGCVWAYQLMPSGLMPETAHVMPCETLDKCQFNQTAWYIKLDQAKSWRDMQVAMWEEKNGPMDVGSSSSGSSGSSSSSSSSKAKSTPQLQKPSEVLAGAIGAPDLDIISEMADKTSSSGGSSDPDKIKEAEKLQDAADQYGTDEDADLTSVSSLSSGKSSGKSSVKSTDKSMKSDGLDKRAAVLPPSSKDIDDKASEIPDSLKKKISTGGTEEASSPKDAFPSSQDSSKDTSTYSKDTSDSSKDTSDSSKDTSDSSKDTSDSSIKSVPKFTPPERTSSKTKDYDTDFDGDRPLTHEEYAEARIRREGLPPGFTELDRTNYLLRPEAIESVWYMYRITGDATWMDKGWTMFDATVRASRTELANSAVDDVTDEVPSLRDEMESFWIAETLKYYYLLFSEPDVISLDDWVLNTEAHPFKRPAFASTA